MNWRMITLALAMSLGVSWVVMSPPGMAKNTTASTFHPMITLVEGSVKIMGIDYATWEPAEVGTLLLSGDIVKAEADGRAEIQFLSGKVQLYENSVIVIPSTGVQERKKDIKEIIVQYGNALFDINPTGVRKQFEFRTKNVQGGVKGTLFTVSYLKNATSVNVYEGVVEISDLERSLKTKLRLTAGESITIRSGGDFGESRTFDPSSALVDYKYNVPPGLDGVGLPADYNSNPDNNGVRDRGQGIGRDKEGSESGDTSDDNGDSVSANKSNNGRAKGKSSAPGQQ